MTAHTFSWGPHRVIVDPHGQRLHAELPPDDGSRPRDERIYARVSETGIDASFTPLFALRAVAKSFDDQLIERLEALAHDGVATHPGLFAILETIRARLATGSKARGLLDAARHLMGDELPDARESALAARMHLAKFRADRERSTPIGFYSRTMELRRLFQHDRLLQGQLDADTVEALRAAIIDDATLREDYRRHLALIAAITNRLASPSVIDEGRYPRLVPASGSREKEIVEELFESSPPPPGFELVREIIARIRDGRLDTTPRPAEGFYQHQQHANAALLQPESARLSVGSRYAAMLEDTFRALFAMTRESHVKQLEVAIAGAAPKITVSPRFSLEPIPEHYSRTASAYAWLRGALSRVLGPEALTMLWGRGETRTIEDAIRSMEQLFRGAEAASREELGETEVDAEARASFRAWQSRSTSEPALHEDTRIAVPLYEDDETKLHRIAVVLGMQRRTLRVSFATPPEVTVCGDDSRRAEVSFAWTQRTVLEPVTIEVDVKEVPTREQLRAICDRSGSIDAIRAALRG